MTQMMKDSDFQKQMERSRQRSREPEIQRPYAERTRIANEVGSAIVHQLNGPLTALRLYIGEIKENSGRLQDSTQNDETLRQMLECAFQETERVCALMKSIADGFEEPLYPETAAARGRDVISRWSRGNGTEGVSRDNARGAARAASSYSIHAILTPREREVLSLISQGCSNKQGARIMNIGPRTFESHRARLMRKLGARNAADLVRMALGDGSVSP